MTEPVEIVATGLTGPRAVEVLHAHADRVDALRERAKTVLDGIELADPIRPILAVDQLRHTGEADGFGLADLFEAVEWADRQPLPIHDGSTQQTDDDMANARRVAEGM